MKIIITLVIGLGAIGALLFVEPDTETYERPVVATSTVEVVEEKTTLEVAKESLDKANELLDAEETRLLGERASTTDEYDAAIEKLKAEKEAKIKEYDAQLEDIRETRTSF